MNLPIVTLSRQLTSGGDAIARGVAQALELRLVDRRIINQAAVEAGVPRVAMEELEYEGRRSLVDRILSVVYGMPAIPTTLESASRDVSAASTMFGSFLSPLRPPMSLSMQEYVRVVGMVIRYLAREGNVVIVGRGGQVVLKDVAGVLHVRVIASFAQRVATLIAREGIDRREAMARLRASDRARANYLERYHGVNWQDTTLYNLILNTDNFPLSAAVAAVVGACQALDGLPTEADEAERTEKRSGEAG